MKLRAHIKGSNFTKYHAGLHSLDPESAYSNPDPLTLPQQAQISESLDCYHATKNPAYQSQRRPASRSGGQNRDSFDGALRPAIPFAQVPTKKAVPIRKVAEKQASRPDGQLESEWYEITALDTLGSQDEASPPKPQWGLQPLQPSLAGPATSSNATAQPPALRGIPASQQLHNPYASDERPKKY